MSLRSGALLVGAAAVLMSTLLASNDASACGGCFLNSQSTQSTVVTGHRMALSVSTERTVLWDQIEYAGDPEEFAWVLPIKPGAYLELGADAFFEALDAATATNIVAPTIFCDDGFDGGDYGLGNRGSGCNASGCGSEAYGSGSGEFEGTGGSGGAGGIPVDPVTVVHQATVGPYEAVTIHSNIPGSLYDWLSSHGFAVDASIEPTIDAYEAEGFDFIALRLIPGANVRQMAPVRVVSPGASSVLPLRMVAAGTGANVAITLFVIGEGRWETANFPNNLVNTSTMEWDFAAQTSNYPALREATLAELGGESWITTYARSQPLLSPVMNEFSMSFDIYRTGNGTLKDTIFGLYVQQGSENGAEIGSDCDSLALAHNNSSNKVVDPCPGSPFDMGGNGGAGGGSGGAGGGMAGSGGTGGGAGGGEPACDGVVAPNEIDARDFQCGSLDDMRAALTGMHPASVWITRLEANLPQAALGTDLELQAELTQQEQPNWLQATEVVNPPCKDWFFGTSRPTPPQPPPSRPHQEMILFGLALAGLTGAVVRRFARPVPLARRTAR